MNHRTVGIERRLMEKEVGELSDSQELSEFSKLSGTPRVRNFFDFDFRGLIDRQENSNQTDIFVPRVFG